MASRPARFGEGSFSGVLARVLRGKEGPLWKED